MQSISDFMNRFIQAMQLKDFYSMEKLYQEMKEQFGDFVFEEERKGNIRFRKKLYQTTFFTEIQQTRVELPKEGIAYLNITQTSNAALHFFENSYMIVSPTALLSRLYQDGAFESTAVCLDVENHILQLKEWSMAKAHLQNGDILKIDVENTGFFLQKFHLEPPLIYSLSK